MPDGRSADPRSAAGSVLGHCLARLRKQRGLTLRELSRRTGIPASTLSKVQNHQATLSYDHLVRLAAGLQVDVAQLFHLDAGGLRTGRRAITPRGQGVVRRIGGHIAEALCADLSDKKLVPDILTVSGRTLDEVGGLTQHRGEAFVYVLSGAIRLHTEFYEPTLLAEGDSAYIDGTMGHAYTAESPAPARVMAIRTSTEGE